MLPRDYRLPATRRIRPLYTYRSPFFQAKVFQTTLPHPRFGFVVSKKVSTSAVERNRIKRRIRGSVESLLPQIRGGYDILFIVQQEALGSNQDTLSAAISRFLSEHHLRI